MKYFEDESPKAIISSFIGIINYNGKAISDDTTLGTRENFIKVNGGIGNINIKTK